MAARLGGLDVQAVQEAGVEDACRGRYRPRRRRRSVAGSCAGRQHHRRAPAGRTCGRSPGRAGRAPGSRRWRPCRSPSGRSWRSRPAASRRDRTGGSTLRPVSKPSFSAVSISASVVPALAAFGDEGGGLGVCGGEPRRPAGWSGAMRDEGRAEQGVGPGGVDLDASSSPAGAAPAKREAQPQRPRLRPIQFSCISADLSGQRSRVSGRRAARRRSR